MLDGQKSSFLFDEARVKPGDFVYASQTLNVVNAYEYDSKPSGYGVVVDAEYYNRNSSAYLLKSSLIGVLIQGQINWYFPDEIFKVESRRTG